jgi:hypothetical protein
MTEAPVFEAPVFAVGTRVRLDPTSEHYKYCVVKKRDRSGTITKHGPVYRTWDGIWTTEHYVLWDGNKSPASVNPSFLVPLPL